MNTELTFKQLSLLFLKRAVIWRLTDSYLFLETGKHFFNSIYNVIEGPFTEILGVSGCTVPGGLYAGKTPEIVLPIIKLFESSTQPFVYGLDLTSSDIRDLQKTIYIRYKLEHPEIICQDISSTAAAETNAIWDELEDEIRRSVRVW